MANLTRLPNKLDPKTCTCCAIVETPKHRRNKFDYDPDSNLFELGGLLPEGMSFPYDFGFIPSTLGEDGDPLDVMVLMDEPAHVGCLLQVRIIGVIEADQTEEGKTVSNARFLAVSTHSYAHEKIASIKDLSGSVLDQIEHFFISYNQLRGKKFKVTNRGNPGRAMALLGEGMKAAEKNNGTKESSGKQAKKNQKNKDGKG